MRISASELLQQIDPQALAVSLRQKDGAPCREVPIEALKVLAAREFVTGIANSKGKLRQIWLTVPADVAFRELGESRQRIKDSFHDEANRTTLPDRTACRRKHYNAVCLGRNAARFGWNGPCPDDLPASIYRWIDDALVQPSGNLSSKLMPAVPAEPLTPAESIMTRTIARISIPVSQSA